MRPEKQETQNRQTRESSSTSGAVASAPSAAGIWSLTTHAPTKAMLEMNAGADAPNAGDVLIPSKVADHRLYVADNENRELGYLSFKDDRLLFGLVPLFERRALGIKMICKSKGRPKKSVDVDLWLRPVEEDATSAIESINLRIKQILNGESQI